MAVSRHAAGLVRAGSFAALGVLAFPLCAETPAPAVACGDERVVPAEFEPLVDPRLEGRCAKVRRHQVHIRFDITADGRPTHAAVAYSDPPRCTDAAALSTVRGWRFPAGAARKDCTAFIVLSRGEEYIAQLD
ncbi:MAG: TonB family protein [Pseudomonadales bacterium]|jgi:TonB family protein|nr:TonB family protein [Pseudomonadales bacterium]